MKNPTEKTVYYHRGLERNGGDDWVGIFSYRDYEEEDDEDWDIGDRDIEEEEEEYKLTEEEKKVIADAHMESNLGNNFIKLLIIAYLILSLVVQFV